MGTSTMEAIRDHGPPRRGGELLGRLALERGLISRDQLAEATALQAREEGGRRLGDILVARGWVGEREIRELVEAQRHPEQAPPPAAPSGPEPRLGAEASMTDILATAVAIGASDIHLHGASPLRFRIDGELCLASDEPWSQERVSALIAPVLGAERRAALDATGQIDFSLTVPGLARFRCNAYRQQRGLDLALRVIPETPPTLQDLGLPSQLARLTNFHQGLVLVTGPAGSGKTSTLAALVDLINEERNQHIVTAEEPIEFRHRSKHCVVNQREVGLHSRSFGDVLRAALREDPDVIAIGELRDHETISLALTAAETGHLVLGTLHTAGAIQTIDRIIGVYPPAEQDQIRVMLSESLRAVVSQRLLRRASGVGRVAAVEQLIVTRAVSNLIRDAKTFQIRDVMQTGTGEGMCLLEHSLAELVRSGTVTRQEAERHGRLLHAVRPQETAP
ncbi:MAG: PilT/PilU family type 4a pilus ATPase [Thermoanaerobaculia bacterium]